MKTASLACALSAATLAGGSLVAQRQAPAAPADLIVVNGNVYPGNGAPFQQAVAVRGNRIAAVGTNADIERLRGPRTEVVDAHGGAVTAGFNDVHAHMLNGGIESAMVRLQGARSLDALQTAIRDYAAAHPDLAWVRGRGWQYEAFPGLLPTREQLDAAVPDRPAVMRCFDGHSLWVNSKALAAAGITRTTPDPPNGTIVRDPKTGEPTGLLKEAPAMALINDAAPKSTRAEKRRALKAAIDEALSYGVTSLTDAAGNPEDFEVYDEARRAGELQARVYYSLLVTPGFTEQDADRFDALWRAHPDTPLLKTGIIKMFMDGVIETNTAFMLAPYANDPTTTGHPNYSQEEFDRITQMMDRRGWQIMVHALGDGAVRRVLNGYERLARVNPMPRRGRRDRVEHLETIDLADVPRFGKLNVIASMHPGGGFTPAHPPARAGNLGFLSGAWGRNIGPERAARGGLWKSISDAGGRVVFGSDWNVASLDAMARITSIAYRPARPGGTDERLPLTTVIDDYTSVSAYASFDERDKGTLAPGMLADIAVLATDVFTHPPETRDAIRVVDTIVDGKVVYRAPAAAPTAASAPRTQSPPPVVVGRSKVATTYGIVAASQPLAARAGAQVLERGGNAVDAAIAANAVMGLVEPEMNGVGGDLFAIVYEAKTGRLYGLNAGGWAPSGLTPALLTSKGFTKMPSSGIYTVTVPGAVAGWDALRTRFGRLPMSDLMAPAIFYAEHGYPVSEQIARTWARYTRKLAAEPNAAQAYLIDGRAPRAGELFKAPDLATTLRRIGERGAAGFYEGPTADAILRISREKGGTMTPDDLKEFKPEWVEPLSTEYRGWTVYELPPNTQGIAALMMLNIMRQLPLADYGFQSAKTFHAMIEAKKLAYADMLRYVGDQRFGRAPIAAMLDGAHAAERARLIDPAKAQCAVEPSVFDGLTTSAGGDTIYLSAIDRDGTIVSLIQSLYDEFGSALVPPGTGFILHDRGALFTMEDGHPNVVAPRKRPLNTIIPAFMQKGDVRIGFGIMGGFNQAQAHAQFVSDIADFGLDIQEALEAGRFTKPTFSGCDVQVEALVPEAVRRELSALGHEVRTVPPRSGVFGYGQAVMSDGAGVHFGASEPRTDGAAIPEAPPVFAR